MARMSFDESVALHRRIAENDMLKQEKYKIMESRDMVVVKSNSLIQKSRFSLSLQEQRIILYIISKIKPEDKKLHEYQISIKDFCNICGIDTNENKVMYQYIRKVVKDLADKSLWIETENGTDNLIRWISKAKIERNKGIIQIKLDEDLMPYLLELKRKYTSYPLLNIIAMKSKYSIRLYELLKSYSNLQTKRFKIDELKKRLDAEKYKDFYKFKVKVLFPALDDIKNYADIKAEPIFIKTKNKYTEIVFVIRDIEDLSERFTKWENIGKEIKDDGYKKLY